MTTPLEFLVVRRILQPIFPANNRTGGTGMDFVWQPRLAEYRVLGAI
jgi:hypothetical protein